MFLRAIDIEVLETDNLAVGLRHDLAHITVKSKLRESVWIQGIFAFVPFAEAMLAAAIRRGRAGVEERDAMLQAEMQQRFGILVVDAHHEVDIILHGIRAGTFMEDGIDIRAVEIIVLDGLKEVILVLVVNELQAAQILVILAILEVVDDQDIRTPAAIEFFDDIAADEAGTTRYDNHRENPLSK